MANKTISFHLSSASIENAIKQVELRQKRLEDKTILFLKKLAEVGMHTAQNAFGSGATVSVIMRDDGFEIHATGGAVCFLEFGAGNLAGSGVDLLAYSSVPFEVRPGSWSEQDAHQYEINKVWNFGGVWYREIAPRMGMYNASKEIQRQVKDIARSVYR